MVPSVPAADSSAQARVDVAFGPDCERLLIREIDAAETNICVAIYNLTRRNIADALADAARRGVAVALKYDKDSAEDDMKEILKGLKKAGVKCTAIAMNSEYAKMHHKFTVIDGKRVLTGSYNYTSSASTVNYENLVLIKSAAVAKQFIDEFDRIKGKAKERD